MQASWSRELRRVVPAPLRRAIRLEAAALELHLVGGAIRDRILGRPSLDLDLVTAGGGAALGRRLAERLNGRCIALGKERFASYRIVAGDLVVDLWDREETSVEADLARRDLTINSIAVDLRSAELIDPFGGLKDLDRRALRATTARSFLSDGLRVLRLARFAATLDGFETEPATLALAGEAVPGLDAVAVERVRDEIERLLAARQREAGLALLIELGLYPRLWASEPAAVAAKPATVLECLAGVERVVSSARQLAPEPAWTIDPIAVSHALLFALLAEPAAAAAASSALLNRGRRRQVADLLAEGTLPTSERRSRWFLHRWGERWLEAAAYAALAGRIGPEESFEALIDRLASLARTHGERVFDPPRLLAGDAVARRLGAADGPRIGAAVRALRRAQVEGRVTTADQARRFVDRWAASDQG